MDEFVAGAEKLGIKLSSYQIEQFVHYQHLLMEWNERINLTAIRDEIGIQRKHFLDSLTSVPLIRKMNASRIIDIGTGAGFPGIPIKIVFPTLEVTLVESVGRKADFCKLVAQEIGLQGVNVIIGRAEEIGMNPAHREKYDIALARAVAIMPTLAEYLLPLVKIGGIAIAQKGNGAQQEAQSAERAIRLLGGNLQKVIEIKYNGLTEKRYLVVIKKISATPNQFPRRVGLAAKRPL
jgi:16S rRNA (guanine527-N7)-methyltransferase